MPSQRVVSIDIFRGLTMLLMIFVNDLAGVHGLPWWNYHLPASVNGMTYVDMVFPTFLFIVGMSLPLAITQRLQKGSTIPQLWRHILARTAGLLVLGIALANAEKCTSMSPSLWGLLVLISGILFWLTNPKLKYVGLCGLVILFALFRRAGSHWLNFSYWEILGIIGWTYLAVCLLYIPTRRWKFAPAIWLIVCVACNARSVEYGAFCSLVFAGVVATQIFLTNDFFTTLSQKITAGVVYAVVLFAAGVALMPLGISKIRATPTWCLFTAAAATLIFLLLHWLSDIKQRTKWAAFAKPAGSNTILTYLLPDLYYFGIALPWLPPALNQGLLGAARAVVFTCVILAVSALLTKWRIRMQL
jgi:heparan-alpha-glucosaminide N-acetyltransferase